MKTIIRLISILLCLMLCIGGLSSCYREKAQDLILGEAVLFANGSDNLELRQLGVSYDNSIITSRFPSLNVKSRSSEERDRKTIKFNGKTYELEYRSTFALSYDTPFDVYVTVDKIDELGRNADFRFAVGTDTLIGRGVWLTDSDLTELGTILPDEELIRIAREYLSDYADMSYYKNVIVNSKSDRNANIYFYNEVGGVMLGDYARVVIQLDGKVGSGFAYPNPSLYDPSLFGKVDTSALEEKRQKTLASGYTFDNISKEKYQYKKADLHHQAILVDNNGKYHILAFYYVTLEIDGKEITDFAHVAVELNEKE